MQSLKKVIFVATLVLANHKVCSQLDTKTADSPEIIPTAITNQAPKLVSLAVENEQVQTTQPASSQVSTAGEASPGAPVSHQDVVTEDNPQATGTAMALLEMFQESLQAYIGAVSSPDQTTPQQADVVQSESTQEPTATASASPQPQYLLLEDQIDTVTDDSQISQQQQYTNDLVDSSVEGNTIGQSDILDDYDDATHNLETLLQGESTSVGIAGLPSVAGDLAESVAETPSGMPVRELQLREGNFSELFSGIAVELDQFEKSAALDDSYTTMYEYLVNPLEMNYECNKLNGSLIGEIVMRDYNSMHFQGLGVGLRVMSQDECCEACKRTQGCSAWTFCNNPMGCGSGCGKIVQKYPRATLEDSLPMEGFGEFSDCGQFDRFPYMMCTLKTIDDWQYPEIFNESDVQGWVSGFQMDPAPVCGWNMSLKVCDQCVNSQDPYACTWCGNWEHLGPDEKEHCSICANTIESNQTSQCLGCLGYYGTQRACGSCVRSNNVEKCLSCAELDVDDENHQRRCYECSKSSQMEECMQCILDPNLSYPYKQLCKLCTRTDISSPSKCMSCLRGAWDINHAQLCPKCAMLGTEVDDSVCFNCLSAVNDPKVRQACLECAQQVSPFYCQLCLQNKAIPFWAKDQCPICTGQSVHPERCMACLQNSTEDSSLECANCVFSSNETFCLDCIENTLDDSLKHLCAACVESSNPLQCMSCMTDPSTPAHAKKFCANCMRLGGGHAEGCVECLRTSTDGIQASACSSCADSTDNNTCYNCVAQYAGNTNTRDLMAQCAICYQSWSTENCLSCLEKAKTQHQVNLCRKCAFSSRPQSCFSCLEDTRGNTENMESCIACMESTNSEYCSWCIQKQNNLFVKQMCQFCLNVEDPESCVKCLDNPKVPEYAKYHCYLCQQNVIPGGVNRTACEDCIKSLDPDEGYFCWNCCQTCGQQPVCPEFMTYSAENNVLPNPDYLVYDYE
eukprot:TRINITY_DN3296_c0_g1_i10.p1 TRINITY_DN3296_c0_g1~~TRINITY_DN3296_c0_g1_i10.p1  ORF type:complete len:965 (-),score=63.20 TRINITY_DN3296_c0_g1_i10:565-3459(-)